MQQHYDSTKMESEQTNQKHQQSYGKVWNWVTIISFALMLGNAIFILVRAYLNKNGSVSTLVLFSSYLVLMSVLGCCAALDPPSAPWHSDTRKKYCFMFAMWLLCASLNLSLALKLALLFGPLAPWFLLGATVAVLVFGFYLIFVWNKQPESSLISVNQSKIQDEVPSSVDKV